MKTVNMKHKKIKEKKRTTHDRLVEELEITNPP